MGTSLHKMAQPNIKIILATTIDHAQLIHQLTQEVFGEYLGVLPSRPTALNESLEDVLSYLAGSTKLAPGEPPTSGIILAVLDSVGADGANLTKESLAGAARFKILPDCFYINRVAVASAFRRYGIGSFLMRYLENEIARPYYAKLKIRLGTRQTLPGNVEFYQKLGYEVSLVEPYPAGIPDFNIVMTKKLA